MPGRSGRQAVVVGAGIAGLSAARVLADFFQSVIVLERDAKPSEAAARPGVPQGRHPHLLLGGGLEALSGLFPGLSTDLRRAGAIAVAPGRDIRTEIPGLGGLPKRDFDISSFAMTRPLLELVLFRRTEAVPNIEIRHRSKAVEILTSPGAARATGVRARTEGGRIEKLDADLVVDASSQGALTRACLEASGRPPPRQTSVGVDIGYATGVFAIPPSAAPDFVAMVMLPEAPRSSRAGYMVRIAEDRWQVLLVGRGRERPPGGVQPFLDFAATLPTSTIANAVEAAQRPTGIARYSFRESVRRHLSGPDCLPAGLLPIGDAICRLNPVYGQGMSVAAQEAVLLREVLSDHVGAADPVAAAAGDFLARAETLIETPWTLSVIPDFAYPATRGQRPESLDELLRRHAQALGDAVDDPEAHRMLLERLHLMTTGCEGCSNGTAAAGALRAIGSNVAIGCRSPAQPFPRS